MVDLPNHSVIIGGLNHWHGEMRVIREERLQAKICTLLQKGRHRARLPPLEESGDKKKAGITAFEFPRWFLAQVDATFESSRKAYRTRPFGYSDDLTNGKFRCPDPVTGKPREYPVVPVRFVQACTSGHIEDINWYVYVRQDPNTEQTGQLWLDEGGAGNDFARDLREVREKQRAGGGFLMPSCRARRRWAPVAVSCRGLAHATKSAAANPQGCWFDQQAIRIFSSV